jgi:hypothetical protein
MRVPLIELPEQARKRLAELEAAKMAAEDAMRSAQGRINSLPRDADQLRERLEIERDRQAERHRSLSRIVSACNQFWMELRLPAGSVLESVRVPEVKLKASETCAAALATVREQIARTQQEIALVRRAPLKRASQQEAIRAYVGRLTEQARPRVGFDVRGNAVVSWVEDLIASRNDLMGILTWVLGAEAIATAFARELEQEPEAANAVSPLEREKKLSELSVSLLSLERYEEALICKSLAEGVPLERRSDANPIAVLNVAIVAQAATQAA